MTNLEVYNLFTGLCIKISGEKRKEICCNQLTFSNTTKRRVEGLGTKNKYKLIKRKIDNFFFNSLLFL